MKEKVTPILQSIGLLESEIKTYLMALKNGPSTVIELSKATKLSRQAIYDALGGLAERGIMSNVVRGKKKFYAAEHPEKVFAYAKRYLSDIETKVGDLGRMVPDLALGMGGERPLVRMFEGKESIHALTEDIKSTKFKSCYEISDMDALAKVATEDDLQDLRSTFKNKKVDFRGIYGGKTDRKSSEGYTRYALPDDKGGFKSSIGVYGNKIEMVTFEGKMHAVIIESEYLSRTLKVLFELSEKQLESKKIV